MIWIKVLVYTIPNLHITYLNDMSSKVNKNWINPKYIIVNGQNSTSVKKGKFSINRLKNGSRTGT